MGRVAEVGEDMVDEGRVGFGLGVGGVGAVGGDEQGVGVYHCCVVGLVSFERTSGRVLGTVVLETVGT